MKTVNVFQILYSLLLLVLMTGCSSSESELNEEATTNRYITVNLGFTGEILNTTYTPLSKSDDVKDYYYFQVYSKASGSDDSGYKVYAYGFFDNKEDMLLNLNGGYEYKFEGGMIVEGASKVRFFSLYNAGWQAVNNSFIISNVESIRYLYLGYLYLYNDQYDRPDVDRYWGELDGYIPIEDESVIIDMKRASFGAKFVARNFTSGQLEIIVEGAPTIYLDSSEGNEIQEMISFNQVSQVSVNDEYSEDIPVNIIWVNEDGVRVPIANENIIFKRNMLSTIEFDVVMDSNPTSFGVNADEVLVDGDRYVVDSSGVITTVTTEE